jgi:hypothetical protein
MLGVAGGVVVPEPLMWEVSMDLQAIRLASPVLALALLNHTTARAASIKTGLLHTRELDQHMADIFDKVSILSLWLYSSRV